MSSDETLETPREPDVNGTKGPLDVEYAELTRLVAYGDTLHTERLRLWVMAHAVFIALLGAALGHISYAAARSSACSE